MSGTGDVLFIGDVHLESGDAHLDAFLSFLDRRGAAASRIVLVGDLFNLWIGLSGMEGPHQAAVVQCFERLRRRGVVVRYLEGNRDYNVRPAYSGTAFDEVSETGMEESRGRTRVFAIHGDLVNESDRQYRTWRSLSRQGPLWWLFRSLPLSRRVRLAESMEIRMRRSNLDFKREFPEDSVRRYAGAFLARGYDAVVLGHFHVEKEIVALPPSPPGRIFILPEWRESRRHLRLDSSGAIAFEDSSP